MHIYPRAHRAALLSYLGITHKHRQPGPLAGCSAPRSGGPLPEKKNKNLVLPPPTLRLLFSHHPVSFLFPSTELSPFSSVPSTVRAWESQRQGRGESASKRKDGKTQKKGGSLPGPSVARGERQSARQHAPYLPTQRHYLSFKRNILL